jgi:hypothetical protein
MDTWEVKPTPIIGLWEVGRLENVSVTIKDRGFGDPRVRELARYLVSNVDLNYYDSSLPYIGVDAWHTDGPFLYELIMCHDDPTTEFTNLEEWQIKGKIEPEFRAERCVVYLMNQSVVHKGPDHLWENPRRALSRVALRELVFAPKGVKSCHPRSK